MQRSLRWALSGQFVHICTFCHPSGCRNRRAAADWCPLVQRSGKSGKIAGLASRPIGQFGQAEKALGRYWFFCGTGFCQAPSGKNPRRMRGLLQDSEKVPRWYLFLFKCEACFAFRSKLSSAADSFFGREQPSVAAPVADTKNRGQIGQGFETPRYDESAVEATGQI